jgi:hypothetical protein
VITDREEGQHYPDAAERDGSRSPPAQNANDTIK